MKVSFFVYNFPVPSETFVINQIIHFIESGFDVEIISVLPGEMIDAFAAKDGHGLLQKTRYLLPAEENRNSARAMSRLKTILKGLARGRIHILPALNFKKYGYSVKNLSLPAIVAANKKKLSGGSVYRTFWPGWGTGE